MSPLGALSNLTIHTHTQVCMAQWLALWFHNHEVMGSAPTISEHLFLHFDGFMTS